MRGRPCGVRSDAKWQGHGCGRAKGAGCTGGGSGFGGARLRGASTGLPDRSPRRGLMQRESGVRPESGSAAGMLMVYRAVPIDRRSRTAVASTGSARLRSHRAESVPHAFNVQSRTRNLRPVRRMTAAPWGCAPIRSGIGSDHKCGRKFTVFIYWIVRSPEAATFAILRGHSRRVRCRAVTPVQRPAAPCPAGRRTTGPPPSPPEITRSRHRRRHGPDR